MKKITVLALIVIVAALAACGTETPPAGATTPPANQGGQAAQAQPTPGASGVDEITVWAWDPNFNIRALDIAAEFFAEVNPYVHVNIVEDAQDSIVQRLNVIFASGTTVGLPNAVLIEDYRSQTFLQAFPGMFYELSAYINPSDFAPYKIAITSFEGRQYGVPFDTGVTGMYVRTDILEEAGFTLADVTNIDWNEFVEIGRAVHEATGVTMANFDPNDMAPIRIMIQTAGVWYTLDDGMTINIANNPAIYSAFEILRDIVEAGLYTPNTDWGTFLRTFNDGDVWSVVTGNWITPSIMAEASQHGNWAVVPTPRLPLPGAVNASNLGGSSWYVINMEGREEAAQFLQSTFGSNVAFYERLMYDIGAMSTFIPYFDSPVFDREMDFFSGQRIFADFATWTEMIPQVNYGLHTYAIDTILSVALQSVLAGGDIQSALDSAQSQAETQLN